ncbi:MAG: hypothetical protein RI957_51 [Verrucomicrobiota bacterium]
MTSHHDAEKTTHAAASRSSSHRKEGEATARSNAPEASDHAFTDEHLVHQHVIHTVVPRGSSVVVAGERDANGKRLFTILTPESGGQDVPEGQIKLASRTYGLDDQQIEQAGMQSLLGKEARLHNQGEIWNAQDISDTQEKWPADAALSMPTVMLEPGSEGVIEIGSLTGEAPDLYRTKVQVRPTPEGFELKTTLQTFRKP